MSSDAGFHHRDFRARVAARRWLDLNLVQERKSMGSLLKSRRIWPDSSEGVFRSLTVPVNTVVLVST